MAEPRTLPELTVCATVEGWCLALDGPGYSFEIVGHFPTADAAWAARSEALRLSALPFNAATGA